MDDYNALMSTNNMQIDYSNNPMSSTDPINVSRMIFFSRDSCGNINGWLACVRVFGDVCLYLMCRVCEWDAGYVCGWEVGGGGEAEESNVSSEAASNKTGLKISACAR